MARGSAGSRSARAKVLAYIAHILNMRRDPEVGRVLDQALALADDVGDLQVQVMLTVVKGHLARTSGRLDEAAGFMEHALMLAEGRSVPAAGIVRWQHASMLMWAGDLQRSSQLLRQILPDGRRCRR
jgi:hypothetical protein